MSDLPLTCALGDYDQTRDLALGRVRAHGIDLRVLNHNVEEIFYRFHDRSEWDVSELSMGMYVSACSRGDRRFVALPIFPSRVFRLSAFYVHRDGPVREPQDLAGRTVGVAQWSQTAGVYARGYLSETAGVPLGRICWVQAGVNDPGRKEPAALKLPADISLTTVTDRSLNDMLLTGEIDAIISARPPRSFVAGDPRMRRLFPDYPAAEGAYFAQTGIFPIMHTVVMRRDVYEANRWIARNLTVAFEEAKNRSVARMFDLTAAHVPLPWAPSLCERVKLQLFPAGDFWPYGVEDNRRTIDAFLGYAFEQGVCHRLLHSDEIFAEEALARIRI